MATTDRLKNQVAIVTGAAQGIGRTIAITFARESAKVVVNDLPYEREKIDKLAKKIIDAGGTALAIQANVGDKEAVQKMVNRTIREFGGVEILVNNAAVSSEVGSLLALTEDDFDNIFQTNVKGVLFCCQAVVPHMKQKHYGKIVNISSLAGLGTSVISTNHLYASTKGAVNILTKRLALELGQHGIYVNAIAPGLVRTKKTIGGIEERTIKERTMLQRIGEKEDIAKVALFLASEESNYITGQVIAVDGGRIDYLTRSS